ncbi:nucleolar and coiled-body phosphoprotein 1-like isoform X1 [Juglans regia]|uniref:Nucleolar and coiled-body phosphoprotein 1-like isoform X1 n=1 Tax=Juglans regia TaxID=51240 RepID=A0A2I4H356_JUGRE|nr:nucleolar and coiled-body phosphoprotein 1-like isoform X1 [Juglans regia]
MSSTPGNSVFEQLTSMPKTLISQNPPVDPALLALKPRQVLLANSSTMRKPCSDKASSGALTADQKVLLLEAVAHFLDRNGFSKALKKFRSEAQVKKDGLKGSAFDLEEIYSKYLEVWNHSNTKVKFQNEQQIKNDDIVKRDGERASTVALENGRKKNGKSSEGDKCDVVSQSKTTVPHPKNSKEKLTNGAALESNVRTKKRKEGKKISDSLVQGTRSLVEEPGKKRKEKKKKKSNSDSGSFINYVEHYQLESLPVAIEEKTNEMILSEGQCVGDDTEKTLKHKKKKKDKPISDSLDNAKQGGLDGKQGVVSTTFKDAECSRDPQVNNSGSTLEVSSAKSKSKKKKVDGSVSESLLSADSKDIEIRDANGKNEKKKKCKTPDEDAANNIREVPKKRKRFSSEENDFQPVDKKAAEEQKLRKVEGLEESERSEQEAMVNASLGSDKSAEKAFGNLEKNGKEPAFQKTKKQRNGSVEPKTGNAFQRVKSDEVVFTDERLKDNSYWAKDGAESGYGAKAQEILGQVRGRDFRHEKTKKKRGTYRGGQIDLQSHSIRFNYSDDE